MSEKFKINKIGEISEKCRENVGKMSKIRHLFVKVTRKNVGCQGSLPSHHIFDVKMNVLNSIGKTNTFEKKVDLSALI